MCSLSLGPCLAPGRSCNVSWVSASQENIPYDTAIFLCPISLLSYSVALCHVSDQQHSYSFLNPQS